MGSSVGQFRRSQRLRSGRQETGYAAPDYDEPQPAYGGDQDVYQVSGRQARPFYGYHYSHTPQHFLNGLPAHPLLGRIRQ